MGCGSSLNENQVNSPHKTNKSKVEEVQEEPRINIKQVVRQEAQINIKELKTQKSINQTEQQSIKLISNSRVKQQQQPQPKAANARIYLFGQTKQQRKIVQFQALPVPHIEILLSRTNNPPPAKYQPPDVILQQSQQLTASNLYISTSHPPYNYMFATFVKYNTIFLCGGINFNLDNVSNQAFYYSTKNDNTTNVNTPSKPDKAVTLKQKRKIGYNLMGTKFERLATMKTRRYSHMGVNYKAGKLSYVYVFGGRTENDQATNKCQKYSISQNKWIQIAPMHAPKSTGFSIIVNKKIYVFGGYTSEGKRSKKIQRYNPSFDSWDILNVKLHKGIETGLILPCSTSNQILIVGGNVQCGAIKTVIRINFENQTYVWDSDMKKERLLQKGVALLDEKSAYVLGGDFEDTIQKYSYKDKTWKIINNLTYGECVSPDDINAFTIAQQTVQLNYDIDANPSVMKQKQNEGVLTGQFKYIFGTDDYPCIYELNTNKWVLKKKNVPMSLRLRSHMSVAKIKEGKIFIGGGIDSFEEKASKAAYIYYPGTNKAIQIAKMKQKKYGFAICSYKEEVYIFGGQNGKEGMVLATTQKYDSTLQKWIQLPNMPRERTFAKALLTPDNKILLVGGTDSLYQGVSQIDIFDPQNNTYSTSFVHFPLACEIKFATFTGKTVITTIKKAKSGEFQFLDDDLQKSSSLIKQKQENKQNKVQIVQSKEKTNDLEVQQVTENYMLMFGYNSYKKQDEAYILSLSAKNPQKISYDEKSYKLYPYQLTFFVKPTQTLNKNNSLLQEQKGKIQNANLAQKIQQPIYYFISNKGVFKWQESNKQMNTQIVINQIHLLQMPLGRFCVA